MVHMMVLAALADLTEGTRGRLLHGYYRACGFAVPDAPGLAAAHTP